jgi:hypothetical protein
MTLEQRREILRLEIVTAKMRLKWIAEAGSDPTTPALTRFIKDSRSECRAIRAKLAKLRQTRKAKCAH